jgi:predicted nucleotide-binding protein
MPPYQLTEQDVARVSEIEVFRNQVTAWWAEKGNETRRRQLRSSINRQVDKVRQIVQLAGCHDVFTFAAPPAAGGMILDGIDPFDRLFEHVYFHNTVQLVFDMLDKTIGVIERGEYERRASQLHKVIGPLGPVSGRKVFLVHGHDESAREGTARFLEKLHLDPIILHEQANEGQTIIEKVEKHGGVAFAVVLLTPDDVGAVRGKEDSLNPRARQNVILELGYFLGRLGRKHVAALLKGDVEKPSDYDGVLYIMMDAAGAWKLQLAKELKAAGLNVDLNNAV